MRSSRRAAAAAISVGLALAGATAANADASTVLYVDGSSGTCTDSGSGTQAAPYCTIQAGANAAVAGDTVDIAAGKYAGALTISSQGTAAAPIVFQAVGGKVAIIPASGQTAADHVTFDGASYVTFEGIEGTGIGGPLMYAYGTLVESSSHITLDGTYGSVEVSGSSSDITVSRTIASDPGTGITIDSGSSGDVISGNWLYGIYSAISVTDAANTAITGNTIQANTMAAEAIGVFGASTGVTVENNIMTIPSPNASAEIAVDSAAAPGTTVDYNVLWPYSAVGPVIAAYSWAGKDYSSASAFHAATGQGAHDFVANPDLQVGDYTGTPTAPQINSANGSAPGMLSTDMYGAPSCHPDPAIAISGAGSPAYCSRGAAQATYSVEVGASPTVVTALSVSLASSLTQYSHFQGGDMKMSLSVTPAVTYTVSWGDGASASYQASATQAATASSHTYAKAGRYTITDTAHLTDGSSASTTTSFTTAGSDFTAYGPARILDTRKGTGTGGVVAKVAGMSSINVKVGGTGSIPANATAVALNITEVDATGGGNIDAYPAGQAKPTTSNLDYTTGLVKAANVIVGLGAGGEITLANTAPTTSSVDLIADVTGYFTKTSAAGYQTVAPARVLDTRKGTGETGGKAAKVPGGGTLAVPVGAPTDATAVVLNLTVTDDPVGGYITAYPYGEPRPVASSLNFAANATVPNLVVVPVGANGEVDLYNYSSQPVDLVADVEGYFRSSATGAFVPVTPTRLYDSRTGSSPVGVDQVVTVRPSQEDSALPSTASAYVYNVTVTGPTGGGYIVAYPAGSTRPNASNVNFGINQTTANSAITKAGSGGSNTGADSFYNASTGTVQLIVDAFGYFESN